MNSRLSALYSVVPYSRSVAIAMNNDVWNTVENLVLRVHRRNGGQLSELDFDLRLADSPYYVGLSQT